MTEPVKVIFRRLRGTVDLVVWKFKNPVYAIFPEEIGENDCGTCAAYMFGFGHCSSTPTVLAQISDLVPEEEWGGLLRELSQMGYKNLKVMRRYQYDSIEIRRKKLEKYYHVS